MENSKEKAEKRDTSPGLSLYVISRAGMAVIAIIALLYAMTIFIDRMGWAKDGIDRISSGESIIEKTDRAPVKPRTPQSSTSAQESDIVASEAAESITPREITISPKADTIDGIETSTYEHETIPEIETIKESALSTYTQVKEPESGLNAGLKTSTITQEEIAENEKMAEFDSSQKSQAEASGIEPIVVAKDSSEKVSPVSQARNNADEPPAAIEPARSSVGESTEIDSVEEPVHASPGSPIESVRPVGVSLVEAIIEPLQYELKDRFWGWRPNDFIKLTDNVKNYQLGVLETTRRAVVQLAQRISRTGSTDAFDRNLENAMSWIMTKAEDYWFPSPETKYSESLEELEAYKKKLLDGTAYFYTRADNLIPLFEVFEDLLGSCDQNLVKQKEADGTKVGTFKADDYFYYAKGVAHAMATILEGVRVDFYKTMENRRSSELLQHAIESCRRAAELEPWIVTNADLDGILANHRANMAAPISHARYYLGQLIITLST